MWRDVSGTVGGGGSNGRWTVVSSDSWVLSSCVPENSGMFSSCMIRGGDVCVLGEGGVGVLVGGGGGSLKSGSG